MTVRRWGAMLALMMLLAACGGSGAMSADSEEAAQAGGTTADDAPADVSVVSDDGGDGGDGVALAGDGDVAGEEPAGDAPAGEELPAPPPVRTGDRIIKEGTITVEVEQGEFDRAFKAVVDEAQRFGGDVVGSSTRTAENGDTFGSVTVRVPVEDFEELVVGVGDIGEIRDRDVDSKDVSAEFTDLDSRLRHLQAQERFYLGLFDQAKSVQDAIAVQQQLDGIQSQIEKIQGRRNLLDDRTTFSTLTVELFEPNAGGELRADDEDATDSPTLGHYWNTARDAFVNVVGAILVAVMFLLPLLVPLAIVSALWLAYRRPRRPAPQPPGAEETEEREPIGADR